MDLSLKYNSLFDISILMRSVLLSQRFGCCSLHILVGRFTERFAPSSIEDGLASVIATKLDFLGLGVIVTAASGTDGSLLWL